MLADAISTTDLAIYLGIYASVVSTAAGLWALFSGVFRDRARVTVRAKESYVVHTSGGGRLLVHGEDTLQTMGVAVGQAREVLAIHIRNRGRRDCRIDQLAQVRRSGSTLFADVLAQGQVPFDLAAETSKTLVVGERGGYQHGNIGRHGFYVIDGAERVHPLRARYLQRAIVLTYGWIVRLYMKRRRRELRQRGDEG